MTRASAFFPALTSLGHLVALLSHSLLARTEGISNLSPSLPMVLLLDCRLGGSLRALRKRYHMTCEEGGTCCK